MKRNIQVHITLEGNSVTALNVTEGVLSNTEFVMEDVDDPITLNEAVNLIREELELKAK